MILALAADHDVVAAFADEFIESTAADQDVVAGHRVVKSRVPIVARSAVLGAELDPVVAFIAEIRFVGLGAEDEVVAPAAEGLGHVLAGHNEVIAKAAEDQVDALAAVDDVVARLALKVIVAADVRDDIIAGAADDDVVAVAALELIVAAVAIERVVALAADENVIAGGAAEDDMLVAGVPEVIRVQARSRRVVANDIRLKKLVADGIGIPVNAVRANDVVGGSLNAIRTGFVQTGELPRRVDLENKARRGEDVGRQVGGIGIRHDQFGERVVLQLGEEVETCKAGQVIEPVTVLQVLQLVLEHEVEGRAKEAAERHLLLGKAADPQVDVAETGGGYAINVLGKAGVVGPGTGAVEEVEAVRRLPRAAEHDVHGRRTLARQRGLAGDRAVRAIGGDEIDQRFRMPQVV